MRVLILKLGEVKENELHGIHTTPKAKYIDDMNYKFYTNSATGGCNVIVSLEDRNLTYYYTCIIHTYHSKLLNK